MKSAMGNDSPRVPPLPEAEWTDETRALLQPTAMGGVPPRNIFTTLVRHPLLFRRWMPFGAYVLFESTLPPRERELVILRVGRLCRSDYEVAQHAPIALACGVSDAEVARTAVGPGDGAFDAWSGPDQALLRAAGELHADQEIGDATWAALRANWSEAQAIDLIFLVGQYTMVAMALKSLRVQVEAP
jgi:alkylhydroperoxidase family enzyme